MKPQLAIFALGARVLMADGANAQYRIGNQTHVRHVSRIFGKTYARHNGAYEFPYLNTEVNRHYKNEAIFAGRGRRRPVRECLHHQSKPRKTSAVAA